MIVIRIKIFKFKLSTINIIPEYQKAHDGPLIVSDIGIPTLKEECKHFGQWLDRIEAISNGMENSC